MYCSHLSTKLNLISDVEKKDSEETWYNQNTTTFPRLAKYYFYHSQTSCIITFLNLLELLTHVICTLSENYQPPFLEPLTIYHLLGSMSLPYSSSLDGRAEAMATRLTYVRTYLRICIIQFILQSLLSPTTHG